MKRREILVKFDLTEWTSAFDFGRVCLVSWADLHKRELKLIEICPTEYTIEAGTNLGKTTKSEGES